MSELNFSCALSNPSIRRTVRPHFELIEWSSELSKEISGYLLDLNESFPHMGEMRAFLSSKCIDEEVNNILEIVKDYITLPEDRVGSVLKEYEKFFSDKIVASTLEKFPSDSVKLVNAMKEIPRFETEETPIIRMGEMDVQAVIEEEVGRLEPVPTQFDFIRRCSPWKAYLRGQVVMVCAAPGCGVGEIEVLTLNHGYESLKSLHNRQAKDISVYSCNEDGEIKVSKADECKLTKYVDTLIEVEIDSETKVRFTEDHPFMMIDGSYKRADQLQVGDSLMPINRSSDLNNRNYSNPYETVSGKDHYKKSYTHKLTGEYIKIYDNIETDQTICYHKSKDILDNSIKNIEHRNVYSKNSNNGGFSDKITKQLNKNNKSYDHTVTNVKRIVLEEPEPVYDLVNVDIYSNFAIRTGDHTGIFVHNSGKSLFLANETIGFLKEGLKVYFVALGDMMRLDFITRFTSIARKIEYSKVCIAPGKYFDDGMKELTKNLLLTIMPAGAMDPSTLYSLVEHRLKGEEVDVVILDYDSNLKKTTDNMYEQGDEIYNTLSELSRPKTGKYRLVMVASQPKINFWGDPELPKESAGESSRKQAIIDLMVTIGRENKIRGRHAGIIKAAKVRRGKEGEKSFYEVTNYGVMEEIDGTTYTMLKTF